MKYLKIVKKILSMMIHKDWESGKLYFSPKKIEKVLEHFGM